MSLNMNGQMESIIQQFKELTGIYRNAVAHSGMSENEFWIWYTLIAMEGDYAQQDICAMWSLSKQTVNTIIMNMAHKGYVTLNVVPGTRNRKTIALTQEGRAYGEDIVRPIFDAEQRAYERVPEDERAVCVAALGKFIRLMREELDGQAE